MLSRPWRALRGSPLIGRERELTTVTGLLADSSVRLISLTGRGGVGKTRLALEIATVRDAASPGSVSFVSLAALPDPELLLAEIAAQLDIAMLPGLAAADAITGWLSQGDRLLVLDNFEHLLAGAGTLTELLEPCPRLQLLITSQAPTRLRAEHVVRVDPLPVPADGLALAGDLAAQPAVELYCDRAAAASSDFRLDDGNAAQVAALCRELEGLPLAIELAAARILTLPPGAMLTRLAGRRLDLLRAARPDTPARHHDLRSAIGWTYGLLAGDERRLLACLSVIVGSFEIEDAEALAGGDTGVVLDGLSALVDVHLADPHDPGGQARFVLPPSVRDFAAGELVMSGDQAATFDRWLTWLTGRASAAAAGLTSPQPDRWWSWLEAAHDSLVGALQQCLDQEQPEPAAELAAALAPYWNARGCHPAYQAMLDRAAELGEVHGIGTAALAEVQLWSGLIGIRARTAPDTTRYRDRLAQGEELARALGDDRLILHALSHRGHAAPMTGELASFPELLAEGLTRATALAEPCWLARFGLAAARMAAVSGADDLAIRHGLTALATARQAGDTKTELEIATLMQQFVPVSQDVGAALGRVCPVGRGHDRGPAR